jgi:hypothetical protein
VTYAKTISPRQPCRQTLPDTARFLLRPQLLTRVFNSLVEGVLAPPVTAPTIRLEHQHRAEEGRRPRAPLHLCVASPGEWDRACRQTRTHQPCAEALNWAERM